jgi:HSP20 family molecular chaperone IbpA
MTEPTSVTKQARELRADTVLLPPVDVVEDAGGITLYADMPGVDKTNINVRVEGDALTIEGTLDLAMPEGMAAHHTEVTSPRYRRVLTLSQELDRDKASAEMNQGVLKLRIPKAQQAKPRRIEVKVS